MAFYISLRDLRRPVWNLSGGMEAIGAAAQSHIHLLPGAIFFNARHVTGNLGVFPATSAHKILRVKDSYINVLCLNPRDYFMHYCNVHV